MNKNWVQLPSFFLFIVVLTGVTILSTTQFALHTADDSRYLELALIKNQKTEQVLGASTTNDQSTTNNLCPESQPVLGFIDFKGNKLILDKLDDTQKPSACFIDISKANADGYFYKAKS